VTRRLRHWLPAIALAAVAGTLPAAPAQADDHAETQALLDQYQAYTGPGAAVHAGDETGAWTLDSGSASPFEQLPITEDHHFRAASQSKTFTAAVVLQLVDEGLVDLDAPIEQYLPGVVDDADHDGGAVSVRQLLQHTSGIARDPLNAVPEADGTYTLAELVRAGLAQPPQFAPGTGWGYSNVNYHLAGMLIESLTGRTVDEAVTERIIEPLDLTDTVFPVPGDRTLADPYLTGYQITHVGPFTFWIDRTFGMEISYYGAAGAVSSTMADLAAFYGALAAGDVVSPESLAEMRGTVAAPALGMDYGLGLIRLDLSCGGEAWGHAGNLHTGHASVTMTTDDGRFASVVTNTWPQSETAPTRYDVIDAALCEGATA
jgi:D-alanyl-D-alanine carboxypeptidase